MLDSAAQDSATVRSIFVIDPSGTIRAILNYPATVGRSVPELLRLLCALQEVDRAGALTPESWQPGQPTVAPRSRHRPPWKRPVRNGSSSP